MIGTPPMDPRGSNDRRKRLLQKLMQQYGMNQERSMGMSRLAGGGARVGAFLRRNASPRLSMPRNMSALGRGLGNALGVQGNPADWEVSPGLGRPAGGFGAHGPGIRPGPAVVNRPIPPAPLGSSGGEALAPMFSAPPAPLGSSGIPGGSSTSGSPLPPVERSFGESASPSDPYSFSPSPRGAPMGMDPEWVPLGNQLYFNATTGTIRGFPNPHLGAGVTKLRG